MDTSGAVVVTYEVVDGSATAGTDFTLPSPTTITFAQNSNTPQNIEIDIIDDPDIEGNETFTVRLLRFSNRVNFRFRG